MVITVIVFLSQYLVVQMKQQITIMQMQLQMMVLVSTLVLNVFLFPVMVLEVLVEPKW